MRISDWSSDVCSSDLIPHMFYQPDLFEQSPPPSSPSSRRGAAALPDLVERISTVSKRPRYALLVLKLIAQEAGSHDSVGPYVGSGKGRVPVRDWLCQALAPLAQRDCRRRDRKSVV